MCLYTVSSCFHGAILKYSSLLDKNPFSREGTKSPTMVRKVHGTKGTNSPMTVRKVQGTKRPRYENSNDGTKSPATITASHVVAGQSLKLLHTTRIDSAQICSYQWDSISLLLAHHYRMTSNICRDYNQHAPRHQHTEQRLKYSGCRTETRRL